MHLKRLDMIGFKSFADRTELEFTPGVTAVVGPNGSGKSNVTDGMRWVLGEQSAKSLRGASMQDVIFSGSDSRKPVGYCEVSITFDNTDHKLHLDYSEVTVTRRVYRSGESEYYINKQSCRLKDITELFMDTGIGKEAYSMIGQGRIDEILSHKSEDRRAIFEEAAGIVKYKSRKREAEKKLESTDQNLSRIQDLVSELEDQVAPLEEQAEKAKQYKEWKSELARTEIGLYVHKIEMLHQNWQEANRSLQERKEEQARLAADVSKREADLEELRWKIGQKEEQLESLQGELLSVSEELEKTEGQREVLQERSRNRAEAMEQSRMRIRELEEEKERLTADLQRQQERLREKEKQLAETESGLKEAESRLSGEGDGLESDLDRLKESLQQLLNDRTRLQTDRHHLEEEGRKTAERKEQLAVQEELEKRTAADLQARIDGLDKELKEIGEALDRCAEQYREQVEEKRGLEKDISTAARLLREVEQKRDNLRSRREIVKEMDAEHAGFFQGVKEILKARDRGAGELAGVRGAVAQLIRVPEAYEAAIETALGGAMQHLVVEDEQTGRNGIRFLKERRGGRATFLPLDVIRERLLPTREREILTGLPGVVGIAADLVETDPDYHILIGNLLGQVIVARTLEDANTIARRMAYRFRVVTLEGDVVNPGGSMSGGSRQKNRANLLGRSRQVEELDQEIAAAQAELKQAEEAHQEARARMDELEARMDGVQKEGEKLRRREQELNATRREVAVEVRTLESQREKTDSEQVRIEEEARRIQERLSQLDEGIAAMDEQETELRRRIHQALEQMERQASEKDEASREVTDWKIKAARLNQEREYLESDCRRLEGEEERLTHQLAELREQLAGLESGESDHREESGFLAERAEELRERKVTAQEALTAAKKERDSLHSDRGELEQELRTLRQNLKKQEEELHQQEVKANRMDVELNHLLEKLAEEYEISFELARERYEKPDEPQRAEREVRSLRGKIASLGEVNLGAIEEHNRLSTRLDFLSSQRDDLLEAKDSLQDVIRNIELEMSNRFQESFTVIREEFVDVFAKMFGGGRADLRLTEPDNLLETGIEIIAQPPGKKPQNLGLLSGGERALAAIALLFAVLRYKPVPFCVLDEVDAALDEANLSRFTRYLREFSQKTQFIIITHRKRTMEGADVMYGVTMEEAGVSKIVSVRLEDFEGKEEAAAAQG
ncbi:chromosome segregation protein SMC [Kroppenstedtia eburnea]|uniref:Chromosome partition protein Smc n=1 Tax=Kroppenstedtia eburnea TaxID=714067 RepID=A0A1N7J146_9BACL|nr:chromosome segregation protein SMC [Kroppenstedtia eburnea]QKI82403.1 chromosome segregation protein SMC [Kroppenstedtia eburnea]SIS42976.1 condensin subunit Smc [Kroppenstedtia eburnea]